MPQSIKPVLSIRWTIPLLIIFPLITVAGLSGWLTFRNGEKTADGLASRLSLKVAEQIEQHLQKYLDRPQIVQKTIADAVQTGTLNLSDPVELRRYFWTLTKDAVTDDDVSNIYFGSNQGDFVGVDQQESKPILMFRSASTAPNWEIYRLDRQGQPITLSRREPYDHRVRPWYKAAIQANQPTWSPVYVSTEPVSLVITAVTPIQNSEKQVVGVLATDRFLFQINAFLQHLEIGSSGQAFIVDRSGKLIGSSTQAPFTQDGNHRLAARDSGDPILQATAQALINQFGNFEKIQNTESLAFNIGRRKQLVQVLPLKRGTGLDWLVVVVSPQSDFMDQAYKTTRSTLIIGGCGTAIAVLLGLLTARWIIQPIKQLNSAAKAVKSRTFSTEDIEELVSRPDEFGELAKLFQQMAVVIGSREESLTEQLMELRQTVEQSKQISRDQLMRAEALLMKSRHTRLK